MAPFSSLKTPYSPHVFSMKPPSSFSSFGSIKLKTLFQTVIFPHMYRITRPVAKAKSFLLKLLRDIHLIHLVELPPLMKNKNKNKKQLFFGSFRLHYNWCSPHVMPLAQERCPSSHVDSCWNSSVIPSDYEQKQEPDELSKYLQWLEEKGDQESRCIDDEIDKLADMFIASCHEKFRLEKQESYRRFQEMMARSV